MLGPSDDPAADLISTPDSATTPDSGHRGPATLPAAQTPGPLLPAPTKSTTGHPPAAQLTSSKPSRAVRPRALVT